MRSFLAIIFIVSSTIQAGNCVVCIECRNNTSPDCVGKEVTCEACMTMVSERLSEDGNDTIFSVHKACNLKSNACNVTFSVSGKGHFVKYTVNCCHEDLCNNKTLEVTPRNLTANGLECPTCYAEGVESCVANSTVQCTGDENRCQVYSGKFPRDGVCKTITYQGCTTDVVCNNFGHLHPDNNLCQGGTLTCTMEASNNYGSSNYVP